MQKFDDNYLKNKDSQLSLGQEPQQNRPFTLKDKAKAMVKCRTTFTERECNIINTFCSSGEDLEYTIEFHDTSKDTVYRLIRRLDEVLGNPA